MMENGTYFVENKVFHAVLPQVMGTRLEWVTVGVREKPARSVWIRYRDWVEEASHRLNRFDPASELSGVNAGIIPVGEELENLIRIADRYRDRTGGLFDIRWDRKGLDFGGLAKGWALSRAKDQLERVGCTSAFINFGGSSILALGSHPHGPAWQVALPNPFGDDTLEVWNLKDTCMSTSGNVPGYTGHIIDPLTGERRCERRVTVALCPDPMDAEVLSTVLMVAPEKAWETVFPAAIMKCYNV